MEGRIFIKRRFVRWTRDPGDALYDKHLRASTRRGFGQRPRAVHANPVVHFPVCGLRLRGDRNRRRRVDSPPSAPSAARASEFGSNRSPERGSPPKLRSSTWSESSPNTRASFALLSASNSKFLQTKKVFKSGKSMKMLEARVGIEPTNKGFADLVLFMKTHGMQPSVRGWCPSFNPPPSISAVAAPPRNSPSLSSAPRRSDARTGGSCADPSAP